MFLHRINLRVCLRSRGVVWILSVCLSRCRIAKRREVQETDLSYFNITQRLLYLSPIALLRLKRMAGRSAPLSYFLMRPEDETCLQMQSRAPSWAEGRLSRLSGRQAPQEFSKASSC